MSSVRKRILPSGKISWVVDYEDEYSKRSRKQFLTQGEADTFLNLVKVSKGAIREIDGVEIEEMVSEIIDLIHDELRSAICQVLLRRDLKNNRNSAPWPSNRLKSETTQ